MICVALDHPPPPTARVNPVDTPSIFVAIADAWKQLRNGVLDTYRPELHYMRGPGPKWREKHDAHRRLDPARATGRYDKPARISGLSHSTASVIAVRAQ